MSLSTRVIAGLAGAAVVGAGLVGFGIYQAVDNGKPAKNEATMVVGTSSITAEPFCYDGGKPLTEDFLNDCATKAQKASDAKKLPRLDVRSSDRIGVGVPKDLADKGWYAMTDGGSGSGRASIISNATGVTYSGSQPATTLMSQTATTSVTVVSQNPETKEFYAVWFFDLNNKR
ncbi:hypothetical protein AB0K51_21995 [Kitasatospora sp. NPDC049285]|uniref:hypothetical protein n=1 Tax=Kitasatospora sp. NPDC049285 TaxID=3157096 RepID=UPI00343BD49A